MVPNITMTIVYDIVNVVYYNVSLKLDSATDNIIPVNRFDLNCCRYLLLN
jgi:hypothetical protein